jgi:hypothetical protein
MDYGIPNIFLDVKPQSIVLIHIRRTSELNGGVISKSLIIAKREFGKVYSRITMEVVRYNYQSSLKKAFVDFRSECMVII